MSDKASGVKNKKYNYSKVKFVAIAIFACIVMLLSFTVGRYPISVGEIVSIFFSKMIGHTSDTVSDAEMVFFQLRFPRVIIAFLVGAGLSIAGAAYQGVFRNPMVSPEILGASAGAGFGATLGILLSLNMIGTQMMAFTFGIGAVALTYAIYSVVGKRHGATLTLVLGGMVISALFQASISIIKYVADPYSKLPAITFWLMGSFSAVNMDDIAFLLVAMAIGLVPLLLLRWRLNLLAFGDEEAKAMGVDVNQLRLIVILCATVVTAAAVAISGIIAWVGLVVPHMVRMIVGADYKWLLPTSALAGGAFLLIVDDVARGLFAAEIPIGILTALIGAPFFVYLLFKGRRGWE